MDRQLIITEYKNKIVSALKENGRIAEIRCDDPQKGPATGSIYIGKVVDIPKGTECAYIRICDGVLGYYPLSELPGAVFTQKFGNKPICQGDELIVQVSKEPIKTKNLRLTSNISITGDLIVFNSDKAAFGISSKIGEANRSRLKNLLKGFNSDKGSYIIRTAAESAPDDAIIQEAYALCEEYEKLVEKAVTRKCYSCLKETEPEYLKLIKDYLHSGIERIVTDDRDIADSIDDFLKEHYPGTEIKAEYYNDDMVSLSAVNGFGKIIGDMFHHIVWLKSGAYLVIDKTEALTVIDVNSGKNTGTGKEKGGKEELIFKINQEAAREIAFQLRLRNISGIIICDFINMKDGCHRKELQELISELLQKDKVKSGLVDVTALQLYEITRKKVRKEVKEYFS